MTNAALAHIFRRIGQLKELAGENPFAAQAYTRTADTIDDINVSLSTQPKEELAKLLGKNMGEKAAHILAAGASEDLNALQTKVPKSVVHLLDIPGLGVKKVRQLWQTSDITSYGQLLALAKEGKLSTISGFGKATEAAFLEYAQRKEAERGYIRLNKASDLADVLLAYLLVKPGVEQAAIVGQLARSNDVINEVALLAVLDTDADLDELLADIPDVEQVVNRSGPGRWVGQVLRDEELYVTVRIDACEAYEFGAKQIQLTGPDSFLMTPTPDGKSLATVLKRAEGESEHDVLVEALGVYVEPELRDVPANAPANPDDLITEQSIKGILHCHSTYSDGKATLRQMATACRNLGYQYFGIADHSQTAGYANGLNAYRLREQWKEIDELNAELAPFTIFKGIESDILPDGALDYPDDVLEGLDYLVASIHSGLRMPQEKAMQRLLAAVSNPYTTILGHPTGRLLLDRSGYPVDMPQLLHVCANAGVVVEINASPWRLDLDWRYIQTAMQAGCQLAINPDAHSVDGYSDMRYGVAVARKGGLTKQATVNTLSLPDFRHFLERRKATRI